MADELAAIVAQVTESFERGEISRSEFVARINAAVPQCATKVITVRLPSDVLLLVKRAAERCDLSLNRFCVGAILAAARGATGKEQEKNAGQVVGEVDVVV